MSRRRRLLPHLTSCNSSIHDSFEPPIRSRQPLADSDPHASYKKRVVIHPSLTNYGPESLQCFLRNEAEKLMKSALDEQRKMIVEYARYLVNAPHYLHIVNHEDGQSFSIVPADGPNDTAEDLDKGKGKGKAPIRRSLHQKSLMNSDERDNIDRKKKPSTTTRVQSQSTSIGKPRQYSKRVLRSSNPISTSDSRVIGVGRADVLTDGGPGQSTSSKATDTQSQQLIDNALNNIDLNQGNSTSYQPFIRASQQHPTPRRGPTIQPIPNEKEITVNIAVDHFAGSISNPALTSADHTSLTPMLHSALTSSPGQLTRAASFENHADQAREIVRTRDAAIMSTSQSPEGSRRRRKTPVHPHGRPMGLTPAVQGSDPAQAVGEAQQIEPTVDEFTEITNGEDLALETACCPRSVILERMLESQLSADKLRKAQVTIDAIRWFLDNDDDYEGIKLARSVVLESADILDPEVRAALLAHFELPPVVSLPDKATKPSHAQRFSNYDYYQIVPEDFPPDYKKSMVNRRKIFEAHGYDSRGKRTATPGKFGPYPAEQLNPQGDNILNALDEFGDFKRSYAQRTSRQKALEPPFCPPPSKIQRTLPHEIWEAGVLVYLSSGEVRTLRLVCKSIAEDLEPYAFRNVVTKFGPSFFSINHAPGGQDQSGRAASMTMLEKFAPGINKFGVSFDYDQIGMAKAPFKITETTVDAWFGKYKWPVKDYPYFTPLKKIDTLLDDQPRLLMQAMRHLTNCHELALSVDSGHGWLDGPDMSDLALYRERAYGGTKVFGKTFPSTDRAYEEGLKDLFYWAQCNTVNENIKHYERSSFASEAEIEKLRDIEFRDYDNYRVQDQQPDYERDLHTGRTGPAPVGQPNNSMVSPVINPLTGHIVQNLQAFPPTGRGGRAAHYRRSQQRFADVLRLVADRMSSVDAEENKPARVRKAIQPQWPIIYSGYNISADVGGDLKCVQDRIPDPSHYPLMPACLTEAQAQWLMETSWIQRTFLTSYTDAIRSNAPIFKNVHSLHISKMSSGLLSSLTQNAFWSSLPRLRTLKIFVKPDWRVEHIPGDRLFRNSMSTKLTDATLKFAHLLKRTIARIESINDLHVGYCSGGEHQRGIYGRNQHVLPAPIVTSLREWVLAQNPANPRADETTMFVFPHVRNLKFENCWFSPVMLETFMTKSQDSSLHHLSLDSVSLTALGSSVRTDGPLRTYEHQLKCLHPQGAWLQEIVPHNASWVHVLDKITPGRSILDQKYDAGMINEELKPRPEVQFRGNTQSITLTSCGYVKLQGVSITEFNQNDLVFHSNDWKSFDDGLKARADKFTNIRHSENTTSNAHSSSSWGNGTASNGTATVVYDPATNTATWTPMGADQSTAERNINRPASPTCQFIMQSAQTASDLLHDIHAPAVTGIDLTGFLTQCIHPIEKRILEQNWGMTFGWGNDMTRWEAVEDGWFMGGTGRFSGTIYKDHKLQEKINAKRIKEMTENEVGNNELKDEVNMEDEIAATPATAAATATIFHPAPQSAPPTSQSFAVAGSSSVDRQIRTPWARPQEWRDNQANPFNLMTDWMTNSTPAQTDTDVSLSTHLDLTLGDANEDEDNGDGDDGGRSAVLTDEGRQNDAFNESNDHTDWLHMRHEHDDGDGNGQPGRSS